MFNLAILVSGGGTTMREIILACLRGALTGLVTPVLVVSSRPDAGAIEKACEIKRNNPGLGLEVAICNPSDIPFAEVFGEALLGLFERHGVEEIIQAGWMPLTPDDVIEKYFGHFFNQHPGPLDPGHREGEVQYDFGGPGLYGRRVHCARLLFAKETGNPAELYTEATTHYVVSGFDRGDVVGRTRVPIKRDDDVLTLQERVLQAEHELQIETVWRIAMGTVKTLTRPEPLIRPEQRPLLEEAKRIARLLFPHG